MMQCSVTHQGSRTGQRKAKNQWQQTAALGLEDVGRVGLVIRGTASEMFTAPEELGEQAVLGHDRRTRSKLASQQLKSPSKLARIKLDQICPARLKPPLFGAPGEAAHVTGGVKASCHA